jgi:ribonuclease D
MKTLPKPILVTQPKQLGEMTRLLQTQPIIAIDTESNSLFAYRERVCLIQFSIPDRDYLVDPLAIKDLSPLGAVFANSKIEKVFHAAEYDLLVMKRDFDFRFANLFDTMVAAKILGREKVGLGNLLATEFGVRLEKKFQKRDWGKRPLPQAMLNYARMDTHYLIRLRNTLRDDLKKTDRLPLAMEDFRRLSQLDGNGPTPQPTNIWRMNGSRDLTPHQATILKMLADYRQRRAEKIDKPLFKVIADTTLVEIAARKPKTMQDLGEIRGMTESQVRRHGKALLAAVQRGIESEPTYRPKQVRLTEDHIERLEALKVWRKKAARKMGVESDVVLPRDLMFKIARENPKDYDALATILRETPWRLERYGQKIQAVLTGG